MINFSELRVPEEGTFDMGKWNGLVDHVGEYPKNLDDQRLELNHPDTDCKLTIRTEAEFGLLESDGGKPLAINMNKNKVGIGISAPEASLHILNEAQNANGNTLILGPTGKNSNLRLGYHTDYSWIQSHGSRPLIINPLGLSTSNKVGIGTNAPKAPLHVDGGTMIKGVTIGHSFTHMNYPYPHETVGVASDQYSLRLQSPNNIYFYTGIGNNVQANKSKITLKIAEESRVEVIGELVIKKGPRRGYIVMKDAANNDAAKRILSQLDNNQLVIGGAWNDHIFFYWKSKAGNLRRARIQGFGF